MLVLSGLLSDETAKTIISAVTLIGSVEQCYKEQSQYQITEVFNVFNTTMWIKWQSG